MNKNAMRIITTFIAVFNAIFFLYSVVPPLVKEQKRGTAPTGFTSGNNAKNAIVIDCK
jgi:hypothetical protein